MCALAGRLLYIFTPLCLIPPLLERVRQEQLSVILIALDCHSVLWKAEMTQMLAAQPWPIPQVWGALSQEAGLIGALPTLGQSLETWLLRGTD